MKRGRAGAGMDGHNGREGVSADPPAVKRRHLVKGTNADQPRVATLVEEVEDVEEVHTVLVRFPCFDFFRNVHLCERRSVAPQRTSTVTTGRWDSAAGSSRGSTLLTTSQLSKPACESAFAPGAVSFLADTLQTDAPALLVNAGTPQEVRFTGQWCEVAGNGVTVSNRAILHVTPKPGADADSGMGPSASVEGFRSQTGDGGADASPPRGVAAAQQPIPSLFPHAVSGITADEKRHHEAALRKGWVYDRIDVPSAVLVMHRAS